MTECTLCGKWHSGTPHGMLVQCHQWRVVFPRELMGTDMGPMGILHHGLDGLGDRRRKATHRQAPHPGNLSRRLTP